MQGDQVTWFIEREWSGQTAVILGGGPSLEGFDYKALWVQPRPRVIAINDSWRLCPWADLFYFCDTAWFQEQARVNRLSVDLSTDFRGVANTGRMVKGGEDPATDPRVRMVRFTGQIGLEWREKDAVRHGSNSGYQVLNLAYHLGVARVLLLGYDMKVNRQKTHWHNAPRPAASSMARSLADFAALFQYLVDPMKRAGVDILNCTPGSALKCWPAMDLGKALERKVDAWQQTPPLMLESAETSQP